jgi:flagellar export protein FliJ
MKNIRHLKIIKRFLLHEKDKYLSELAKVQAMITKKSNSIEKISAYRQEYDKKNNLLLSRVIPALSLNLEFFINEINTMIEKDKNELYKLRVIQSTIINKNEKINNQLAYIEKCEARHQKNKNLSEAQETQKIMDDLIANRLTRITYD